MKRIFFFVALPVLAAIAAALSLLPERTFSVQRSAFAPVVLPSLLGEERKDTVVPSAVNPLTGLPCESGTPIRPVAVMLAGDTVTRPLSGIASADIVVEMPVITNGINRFLAIFACRFDGEIGSVRSARDDFIPIAAAFDAIFAHWGGSHFSLDQLNRHIIDNVDALRNPFGAYFRKRGIAAPHNGFTTLSRLTEAAQKLGYRTEIGEKSIRYPYVEPPAPGVSDGRETTITIGYFGPYRIQWKYDPAAKRYYRFRGGTPERDKNTHAQVEAATIAVMRTTSRQIEGQYNDVRVTGSGEATVYRFGEAVRGRWEKAETPLGAPLRFFDEIGNPVPFAKGPLWIEIVQQDTIVETLNPKPETLNL